MVYALKLVNEDDPILKEVQPEIDLSSTNIDFSELAREMISFMRFNNGLGLAAPQVGLQYRFFVMSIAGEELVCINPKIISVSDETALNKEGCLSFPSLFLKVRRPKEITVEYYKPNGKKTERKLFGMMATCFQHETDHLNGITFNTKVPKLSLKMANEKRLKLRRKESRR